MKTFPCLLVSLVAVACVDRELPVVAPVALEKEIEPPVLVDSDQLNEYVGKVVTLRGEVSNTKIPTIFGVDVRSNDPDLRGQVAEATGVLRKIVVTEEEIAEANYAHRGAGVFYRLKDLDSDYSASVRPVTQTNNDPVQQ